MNPRLSVIIPVFNAERTIGAAIRSLQSQDMTSWEALVVDDGSKDASADIADALADRDRRIRVIRSAHGGTAAARNTGIEAARGEHLLFLDADDLMLSGAFASLLEQAENGGTGAAFGGSEWINKAGESQGFSSGLTRSVVTHDDLLECNRFSVHAAIVRREHVGTSRFDPALKAFEDWEFWIRLAERGVRWTSTQVSVAAYRMMPASRSRNWRAGADASERIVHEAFERGRLLGMELDLSDNRLRRIVLRHALESATATAACDPSPRADLASAVLRPYARPGCIDGRTAAEAAFWAWPTALCRAPSDWRAAVPEWSARLARWWRRCADEGWTGELFEGSATAALSHLIADPEEIADAVVDQLDRARPVVLLGFGQNARRLARALIDRRFSVCARDDAAATPRIEMVDGLAIPISTGQTPIHAASQYVATPTDDAELVSRLPVCRNLVRWSEVCKEKADEAAVLLLKHWPARPAALWEAA